MTCLAVAEPKKGLDTGFYRPLKTDWQGRWEEAEASPRHAVDPRQRDKLLLNESRRSLSAAGFISTMEGLLIVFGAAR